MRRKIAFMVSVLMIVMLMPVPVFAVEPVTVDATDEDQTRNIGDVSTDSTHPAVDVTAANGYTATVTAGNIVNTFDTGDGLNAKASENGTTIISVNGGVEGSNSAIDAEAASVGMNEIDVEESVTGGISASVHDNSADIGNVINVKGNVSEGTCGIFAEAKNVGCNDIGVDGNVSGKSTGIKATADGDASENNITVKGDVTGIGEVADGMEILASDRGNNNIKVGGDVSGSRAGVILGTDGDGQNNIVIEGTLEGGDIGVAIKEGSSWMSDGCTLTVWEIKPNEDGIVAGKERGDGNNYEEDEEFEKNIQYIIRINQPSEGATLRATDSNGNSLFLVDGITDTYEWACEGDTVLLKIDLQPGYTITNVYGDEGKTVELSIDENGNYYLTVPRGGGVCFSVELTQRQQGNSSRPDDSLLPTKTLVPAISRMAARLSSLGDSSPENTPEVSAIAANAPVLAAPAAEAVSGGLSDSAAVALINSTPAGGVVTLYGFTGSGLSASVVAALLARPDVSVTLTYIKGGVTYMINIPVGANLAALKNASGGIDFSTLESVFGSKAV